MLTLKCQNKYLLEACFEISAKPGKKLLEPVKFL